MHSNDLEPIRLAALFHNAGNTAVFAGHDNHSITEAGNSLSSQDYLVDKITLVIDCIKAT